MPVGQSTIAEQLGAFCELQVVVFPVMRRVSVCPVAGYAAATTPISAAAEAAAA